MLEAIFFILHTGIQWEHLPKSFPPKSTVHDRLQLWSANQAFRKLLAKVVRSLAQKGRIDLDQCFIDATFAPAKGGGEGSLNPVPACLANALCSATGARVRRLPLTPERVWRALKFREENDIGR